MSDDSYATKALTARIPHLCDSCHWTPSLRGMPTILPGHRYLRHTVFPNDETNQSNRPYTLTECVPCAEERDSAGVLVAGASSTFSHGTVPCALPLRHDGDHSCRCCTNASAAVA
jgi:hypothetical protein